jgi:hypothetical protein
VCRIVQNGLVSYPWRGRVDDGCRIVQSGFDGYLSLDGASQIEYILELHPGGNVGKLASIRCVYPTPLTGSRRYLHLSPRWYGGKLVFAFPVEQAHSGVLHLDSRFGEGGIGTGQSAIWL